MFTIRKPSNLVLLLLAISLLAGTAQAANWPRTFSGQPDFDFTREEVVKELQDKKTELGFEPYIATLEDIIGATEVNPFDPKPRYRQIPLAGEGVTRNPFLPEQLLENESVGAAASGTVGESSLVDLPDFDLIASDITAHLGAASSTTAPTLDLSEFENYLDKLARELSAPVTELDLSQVNLAPEVQQLGIQSIVTSPLKYAIINGRRYKVGDTLPMTLQIPVVASPVDRALEAELPNKNQLDAATYAAYKAVYDKVMAKYSQQQTTETVTKHVQAYIKRIESRTVVLTIFGKEYELKWRLLL